MNGRIHIEFRTTGNVAFEGEGRGHEIARILRDIAERLKWVDCPKTEDEGDIRDVNGNKVGEWYLTEGEEETIT